MPYYVSRNTFQLVVEPLNFSVLGVLDNKTGLSSF